MIFVIEALQATPREINLLLFAALQKRPSILIDLPQITPTYAQKSRARTISQRRFGEYLSLLLGEISKIATQLVPKRAE